MTIEATLTSKGQTTIPKEIREGLRLSAGDRITFTLLADRSVILRAKTKSATDVAGALHRAGRKVVSTRRLSR